MRISIRLKVLLSVGLTVFVVLGTTTIFYIRDLKQHYVKTIQLRSDALAQGLLNNILKIGTYTVYTSENIQHLWASLTPQCQQIYDLNKDKEISHIALISSNGTILAHNLKELRNTNLTNPALLEHLKDERPATILVQQEQAYHTFIPIFSKENTYLGVVDVGISSKMAQQELQNVAYRSIKLLGIFLLISGIIIFLLISITVTKPIRDLGKIGERLAEGHMIHHIEAVNRGDEIASLAKVFIQISDYLGEVSDIAERVATGVLAHDIRKRSKRDVLGIALQEMLNYLQSISQIAFEIAEGDLSKSPPLRSDIDAFGRAMRSMTSGLQDLIKQIRTSSEQISTTGATLASLAAQDNQIVKITQSSVEEMVSTMTEMGVSVEEVAHNMDILSASVEETSASMAVMTTSITNIADNTIVLAQQTQQAILEVNNSTNLLKDVTQKTEISRQLSQKTIQDALEGQQAVEEVMTSMESIQQTNSDAFETITHFEQQTQDIGSILDVIDEITDQSAMLALNASIIAAQAGSGGKGFAVIADEMKNLANRVNASTKNIAAIVKVVEDETTRVVKKIYDSTTVIGQGVKRTEEARKGLENIFASAQRSSSVVSEIADAIQQMQQTTSQQMKSVMERVNSMTTEITNATSEQKSSTIQINQAIDHISQMAYQTQQATTEQLKGVQQILAAVEQVKILTEKNMESSEHIDLTSADLTTQAQILLQAVDRFKLGTTERITEELSVLPTQDITSVETDAVVIETEEEV
ncbi:MAG: HAMP domain-containing methyl-accepting chemotaxis protein [Candidatus Vecturithrix sp.]|jgi:methyl-accepting chemotaxis protein|nr:HAMP domain-containing methyl-accepting chemotaxis protein [Candidatus Vecturithrix sp.]